MYNKPLLIIDRIKPCPAKTKLPNFEKSLEDLEKTIEHLETGDLTLEESIKQFEKGVSLIKSCQNALNQADNKIRILVKKNDDLKIEDWEDDPQ